jgi:4-hydroxybenzoate polyprenyltransferase
VEKNKAQGIASDAAAKTARFKFYLSQIYARYEAYIQITRLNKPIGILLLLWPTLWALWIASEGVPEFFHLIAFILGVVLTRSAGCVINDFFDRNYDGRVQRTSKRPLVTGALKPVQAIYLFLILSLLALLVAIALAISTGSLLVLYFAAVSALLFSIYPLMKRFTHLPQVVLGMAFAMSVLMAYVVVKNKLPPIEAWILYIGVVLWATFYDTMYALVDKADDVKVGVKSTAILFGEMYRLILGIIFVVVILSLLIVGDDAKLGMPFYIALGIASVLGGYQFFLIHDRKPEWCFRAFLNSNWFGAVVFLGIFFHYLFKEEHFSLLFIAISIYVASIILVYNLALLRRANMVYWMTMVAVLGPVAVFLVVFAKRDR